MRVINDGMFIFGANYLFKINFLYDSNYFQCQASYAFKKQKYISIFFAEEYATI